VDSGSHRAVVVAGSVVGILLAEVWAGPCPLKTVASGLARRSLRRQSALVVVIATIRRIHPEREFHLIARGTRATVPAEAVGDIAAAVTHVEVPSP
jgi:hypothetical protein